MANLFWTGAISDSYSEKNNWWNTTTGVASVPVDGDVVVLDGRTSRPILDGLDQSLVTLGSFSVMKDYSGTIGTDAEPLRINADKVDVGAYYGTGNPSGSQQIKLNLGPGSFECTVHDTGTNNSFPTVDIAATWNPSDGASQILNVLKGQVSLGFSGNDCGCQLVNVGNSNGNAASLYVGRNCAVEALTNLSGSTIYLGRLTNLTVRGGTVTFDSTDDIYQYLIYDGTCLLDRFGEIENFTSLGGLTDMLRTPHPRTVVSSNIEGGKIKLDPNYVDFPFVGSGLITVG